MAFPLLALLLAAGPAPPAGIPPATRPAAFATVTRELVLMGTRARVRVTAGERQRALRASEAAIRALEATERRLSTWSDGGELARLNRAPVGQPVALSPELAADLARAEECARATGGAFDPAVGALVAAWGLREGGRLPGAAEVAAARAASAPESLVLGADGTAVRSRSGLRIDEGGFGKGAGIDAALAAVAGVGGVDGAEIDLGGQVAFLGAAAREVAIADPARRERPVAVLRVAGGSVATSGNSERGVVVEGRRVGHLLDPRTGRPAPDFGSLTVWAPSAFEADCLSTGLYVLGPEAALAWAAAHPGIEVVVARPAAGGVVRITASAGLADRLRPIDDRSEVELKPSRRRREGASPSPPRGGKGIEGMRGGGDESSVLE